ncbi:MAG: 3D domain-containing protein [Kiritimatiellae bacterium]|nr:3D domain-containing protein [Kiritimatiellia bacterium]
MKSPLNILSALALASAALTVLPACKAVPKDATPAEPTPAVSEAPAETSHTWFAKKGQRRRAKAATPAPTAVPEPVDTELQTVIVTGYCSCPKCCGAKAGGLTATGTKAQLGTIAADPSIFPFGTQLNVPGYGEGVVEDTGSRVKGFHIDVWFPTHAQAQAWGSREMYVAQPSR